MFSTSFQVNCVGITLVIICQDGSGQPVNLAGVSAVSLIFQPPSPGNKYTVVGTVLSAPDGTVQYVILNTDFAVVGVWKYQARVQFTDGRDLFTRVTTASVLPNL